MFKINKKNLLEKIKDEYAKVDMLDKLTAEAYTDDISSWFPPYNSAYPLTAKLNKTKVYIWKTIRGFFVKLDSDDFEERIFINKESGNIYKDEYIKDSKRPINDGTEVYDRFPLDEKISEEVLADEEDDGEISDNDFKELLKKIEEVILKGDFYIYVKDSI